MLLPMFTVNVGAWSATVLAGYRLVLSAGIPPSQLGGVERTVDYLAISPAARASH
jgi:hypothetical protein